MAEHLINYFHCSADNIGDRLCGPAQYLWPTIFRNHKLNGSIERGATVVIIGGGQIFRQLEEMIHRACDVHNKTRIIVWGVGLPKFGSERSNIGKLLKATAAFSTRNFDWREQIPFVPCASCLSPLFDTIPKPAHEFVVYSHRRKPGARHLPPGTPTMTNSWADPKTAIDFLASGETVVTSSYHGVYWAQLIGRRVICIPYNSKFETFQHQPKFSTGEDWLSCVSSAPKLEPLLLEYRHKNLMFAKVVEAALNG